MAESGDRRPGTVRRLGASAAALLVAALLVACGQAAPSPAASSSTALRSSGSSSSVSTGPVLTPSVPATNSPPVSIPAGVSNPALPSVAAPQVTRTVTGTLHPALQVIPWTLSGIAFGTPTDGVAVGYRCAAYDQCTSELLRLTAGGTWAVTATVPAWLEHVHMLRDGFGWSWGLDALYTTGDGGRQWQRLPLAVPTGESLLFATFSSPDQGWVGVGGGLLFEAMGSPAPFWIYATTDGGQRWTRIAGSAAGQATIPASDYDITGGGGLGQGHGWILFSEGLAITTDDGGHWSTTLKAFDPTAAFANAADGWAVAAHTVYQTTDGGARWTTDGSLSAAVAALAPTPNGNALWALVNPSSVSPCGGHVCAGGVIVVGTSSAAAVATSGPYVLHTLAAVTSTTAWAIASGNGPGYRILRTTDGGRSWTTAYQTGASYIPLHLWGFWNAANGWALGAATAGDAVLRTQDGGQTWTLAGTDPVASPTAGGFVNPEDGWVLDASNPGELFRTTDGGRRWTRVTPPSACPSLYAAGMASPTFGWAACAGHLFTTGNAGQTWSAASLPAESVASQDIVFTSARGGWDLVGNNRNQNVLYRATDGGQSWAPVAGFPTSAASTSCPDEALAVGPTGSVWLGTLTSADGGQHWTCYGMAATSAMEFVTAQDGWAQVGQTLWQGLFRTTDGGTTWQQVSAAGR